MAITQRKLTEFQSWMVARGRTEGTAALYAKNVATCQRDPKGLTNRLVASELAPNTMRANIAALRAWAIFTKDGELTALLADMRLPPARRVKPKIPLELEALKRLIQHLRTSPMHDAKRQVLLMMALRGFRSGDVLRIRRPDVLGALATGRLVYEGKGRKRIDIAAAPVRGQLEALAAYPRWSRVSDLVSNSKNPRSVSRLMLKAARSAGKAVGVPTLYPHQLRRTFATRYLAELAGDPNALVKLQRYMGWESIGTAAGYVDAVSQDELDAIGAGLITGLLD